jgi:hypothetical protein
MTGKLILHHSIIVAIYFYNMKKLMLVVVASFSLLCNARAQQLKLLNAESNGWEGGAVPRDRNAPPAGGINYTIALSCDNYDSLTLDSIYICNVRAKLLVNANFTVDKRQHPSIINIHLGTPTQGFPSNRKIDGAGLIIYEYKGIKCSLLIKEIKAGRIDHHS